MSRTSTTVLPLATGTALALGIASALAAQNPTTRGAADHASTAATATASTPAPEALRFDIDPSHTRVTFTVRHLMVTDVDGRLTGVTGAILLDTTDVHRSSVDVEIDASTIDTGEPRRDAHLRSADFLDVERHPTIRFSSRAIDVEGDGLVLIGDLTLRGVTREVRIPFELRGPVDLGDGRSVIGAEGRLTIDRHDYGVSWSRFTDNGGLVVGNDVEIRLRVEAVAGSR